ncbi:MAG TPA: DUF3179 domain-containing (seleno)protein [Thermoanaerobaculia bacterium]|jgi:hypothetical protein|nr:DUF3179 domain-containing (seleno)protein [Thermoanaerobaculia bacterium]
MSTLFFACGALSLLIALLGLLALGDMVQLLVAFPRAFTYAVFRVRMPLMAVGLALFAVTLYLGFAGRLAPGWALALYAAAFAVLFFGGFVGPTYVLFRTQQGSARYVPVAEIAGHLEDDAEVFTVEVNGDARAFPHRWIQRPHVAGDVVGGQPVAMTYCALSHLGMAYGAEDGGRVRDLKVMTQLENNLVLFDASTQEPIEQIYGRTAGHGGAIPTIPSTVMPFRAFRGLYPQGNVFFNPPGGFLDRLVRGMMDGLLFGKGGQYDLSNPKPVFPTIDHVDPRVPPKEQVYGIALDGEAVAFTLGHLEKNGGAVTERIGQSLVTVKHFPDLGFVDVFTGDVKDVDARGFRPSGERAPRVPHASRVLWMIWANFYRETGVRV